MGHQTGSPSPKIQITVLTIATLLILTLLILIIGPSRILSDSVSSTSCSCPKTEIYITNGHADTVPTDHNHADHPHNPSDPTASTPAIPATKGRFNRVLLKAYNDSDTLKATHISPEYPLTWDELLSPPNLLGSSLRAQEASLAPFDDYPDNPAVNGGGDHGLGVGVAMMHQMHCLISLRGLIFPDNNVKSADSFNGAKETGDPGRDQDHWSHCFEYIAQAIMCSADDTLEITKKRITPDGGAWWHVDGVGAIHQCKDPRPLWEMSIRSHIEPVDMSRWREGVGAREYFAEELKDGYRYDIPEVWEAGLVGEVTPKGTK
ncbi:hypothetical protein BJX99DRAFT_245222 [Aspergillus californicus]